MTAPLEDYAMIGDRHTAALVGRNGSIDWLCWPRFDSDACFAALLGTAANGRWLIGPDQPARVTRRYQTDTLVLETDFETADSAVRIIDFMPCRDTGTAVVRIVEGLRGQTAMQLDLRLRFDYGKIPPWTETTADGFRARIGPDQIVLRGPVPCQARHGGADAAFIVSAGQRLVFTLQYGDACRDAPAPLDVPGALADTQRDWRDWIGRFDKPTLWPDATRRSLLTLRALIYAPSGGLVAAPTTSLPETPGGKNNWDYRYCWLRDATFTVSALLNAGYHQEAQEWRDWILRALAGTPSELRILYRVDGSRHVNEWDVDWLPGYRYARPVRVGNAAAAQRQIDVMGEVLDTLGLCVRVGLDVSEQERHVARAIAERIEAIWQDMGQGIWESRGEPRQYTYSKVMAWVGIDRVLQHRELMGHIDPDMQRRLQATRARIHRDVCEEGYHTGLGSFVQYYGGEQLDASLLLMPLVNFLRVDDPRIANTISAIERELMQDGLVRRKSPPPGQPEGAFLACSCWLADCRQLQGRHQEARDVLDRMLSVRNDVGLLSEEYDLRGNFLSGNFPQALTHLAVVTTTLGLSGPVVRRGGG
ncbi:MAG: glucoamylase [Rhodospirillales bacterium 20-64-7]|nr:MAG: glucoamylase [Rhodospirillales bacterium 20-64-7]HQT78741.1 glycoside hydrolase family 15 protein [Rhodopila sp.]